MSNKYVLKIIKSYNSRDIDTLKKLSSTSCKKNLLCYKGYFTKPEYNYNYIIYINDFISTYKPENLENEYDNYVKEAKKMKVDIINKEEFKEIFDEFPDLIKKYNASVQEMISKYTRQNYELERDFVVLYNGYFKKFYSNYLSTLDEKRDETKKIKFHFALLDERIKKYLEKNPDVEDIDISVLKILDSDSGSGSSVVAGFSSLKENDSEILSEKSGGAQYHKKIKNLEKQKRGTIYTLAKLSKKNPDVIQKCKLYKNDLCKIFLKELGYNTKSITRPDAYNIVKKLHYGNKKIQKGGKSEKSGHKILDVLDKLYNFERTDVYLFTDYLEKATTLWDFVQEYKKSYTKLKTGVVLKIMYQLIDGLYYMHKSCIAHEDIKPTNIIINKDTHDVQIIDYGLSCVPKNCNLHVLCDHAGTLDYMSPTLSKIETPTLADRQKDDVYALGLTLFKFVNPYKHTPYNSPENYFTSVYSDAINTIINGFLDKNPDTRLELSDAHQIIKDTIYDFNKDIDKIKSIQSIEDDYIDTNIPITPNRILTTRQLENYKIIKTLGSGAFGSTYLVEI